MDFNEDFFRDFKNDLGNTKTISKAEWEKIIHKCFGKKCEIIWKDDKVSQLDFGSDLLIKTNKGRKFSADIKTRHEVYFKKPQWSFEITHHRYTEYQCLNKISSKSGWLYNSTSDLIIYATRNHNELLECCIFSLYPFKDLRYASKLNNFIKIWSGTKFENGIYQLTLNKLVPQDIIKGSANFYFYWCKEDYSL